MPKKILCGFLIIFSLTECKLVVPDFTAYVVGILSLLSSKSYVDLPIEVKGLQGKGLVLQNNGGSNLDIAEDGKYSFKVEKNTDYDVSVYSQPTEPWQTCSVTNGSGTASEDVANVVVDCVNDSYRISGYVYGLDFGNITIQNGNETLTIEDSGEFYFPSPFQSGTSYDVIVTNQPGSKDCSVENGTGIVQNSEINIIKINCSSIQQKSLWVTDREIRTMQKAGDILYIGGTFNRIGKFRGQGAVVDKITREVLSQFDSLRIEGQVNVAIPDGSGGFYVGGDFSKVNGLTKNKVFHLLSDGSIDPNWSVDVDGSVRSLIKDGSYIYIGGGGSFRRINGVTRRGLGRVDATTGVVDPNWNPNAMRGGTDEGQISAILVDGSDIYVGGNFDSIGGQALNHVAKLNNTDGSADPTWNPNPSWAPTNNGVNIYSLMKDGSYIYIGGSYSSIGGISQYSLARVNITDGAVDLTWLPANSGGAFSVLVDASGVYVSHSGDLYKYDKTTGNAIWSVGLGGGNGVIYNGLFLDSSYIYLGGNFTIVDGTSKHRIARFNRTSGTMDTTWDPGAGGNVQTVAVDSSKVFLGGEFFFVGGVKRQNLAAIDTKTGIPTSWNPNSDCCINTIVVDGEYLYVGGSDLFNINGQSILNFTRLFLETGNLDTTWNFPVNDDLNAITIDNTHIYLGGRFTSVNGVPRNKIARIDKINKQVDMVWNPNADDEVEVIASDGLNVYAAGDFTSIGGQAFSRLAKLDLTNGQVNPSWNPAPNSTITSIVYDDNYIYVGGNFSTISGNPIKRLARYDKLGILDLSWDYDMTPSNARVEAMTLYDSYIFLGGYINRLDGVLSQRLGKIGTSTVLTDPTFTSIFNGKSNCQTPKAIVVDGAGIYFGSNNNSTSYGMCPYFPNLMVLDPVTGEFYQ